MAKDAANKRTPSRVTAGRQGNLIWYGVFGAMVLLGAVLAVNLANGGGDSGNNASSGDQADSSSGGTSKVLAPDFEFTLYQGSSQLGAGNLALSDLRGRPVVLNFWAGQCPPCRAEMPDFQLFYEDFNDQVTVVGIDVGQFIGLGDQQDARNLLDELSITYPTGFANDANVVRQYQVLSMPTTVFINSRGEVFRKRSGLLNRDVLAEVTTMMLNQESGSPA